MGSANKVCNSRLGLLKTKNEYCSKVLGTAPYSKPVTTKRKANTNSQKLG